MENTGQNGGDKQDVKLVPVLWKSLVLVFLAIFPDETSDVEESSTTFILATPLGSLPQEPDRQPRHCTNEDQSGDDESGNVETGRGRTAPGSREDMNGLGCH